MASPPERPVQRRHSVWRGAGRVAAFFGALPAVDLWLARRSDARLSVEDRPGVRVDRRGRSDPGKETIQTARTADAGCLGAARRRYPLPGGRALAARQA